MRVCVCVCTYRGCGCVNVVFPEVCLRMFIYAGNETLTSVFSLNTREVMKNAMGIWVCVPAAYLQK